MVDAVGTAFAVGQLVVAALQGVSVNKETCAILRERWERMQAALEKLQVDANSTDLPATHGAALDATIELGRETLDFIQTFSNAWLLRKAISYEKHRKKFQELGARLDRLLVEMQLGISVNTQAFLQELNRKYDADAKRQSQELTQLRDSVVTGQATTNRKVEGVRTALQKLDDLQRLQSTANARQNEDIIAKVQGLHDELRALRRIVSRSRSRSRSRGRSQSRRADQDAAGSPDAAETVSMWVHVCVCARACLCWASECSGWASLPFFLPYHSACWWVHKIENSFFAGLAVTDCCTDYESLWLAQLCKWDFGFKG